MKINYSKFSSKEIYLLLQAFMLAIPALKTGDFAGVHKTTIQKFFTKLKLKITENNIKNYEKLPREIVVSESYVG